MGIWQRLFGPPTEEQFAKRLTLALRRAGDNRVYEYDPSERRLVSTEDGEPQGVVNLVNLYQSYIALPRRERAACMRQLCSGLVNRMPVPEEFEDVRPDLRPAVRTRAMFEFVRLMAEIDGEPWQEMPGIAVSDYMVANLVYDMPSAMRFVTQEDLDTWDVSTYEAMEVARQNLAEMPGTCAALEGLYIFMTNDSYDASGLLSLDLIRKLEIKGVPVALPMKRDLLFVAGDDDVTSLQGMAKLALEQMDDPRPVCSVPHRLEGDEWKPWLPPAGHEAHEPLRRLAVYHMASEYEEQRPLLEKLNEQNGIDVYVAKCTVVEHITGPQRSYCVWPDVPTWLPRTDQVAFKADADAPALFVDWEDLVEVAGDLMTPLDYWPPRFAVSVFPESKILAQLKPSALGPQVTKRG